MKNLKKNYKSKININWFTLDKRKDSKWFTLIELLVVIAVIWIMALWLMRIDMSSQIDRQNLRMFSNEIHTTIESTRNASLLWQWVLIGWEIKVPYEWKIRIDNSESKVERKYKAEEGSEYTTIETSDFIEHASVQEFRCFNIEWEKQSNNLTDSISIKFEWRNISIEWCDPGFSSIIEIVPIIKNNPAFSRVIKLNTLSWLISQDEPN